MREKILWEYMTTLRMWHLDDESWMVVVRGVYGGGGGGGGR